MYATVLRDERRYILADDDWSVVRRKLPRRRARNEVDEQVVMVRGGGGKGRGDGRGMGRSAGVDGRIEIDLWKCPRCRENSFATRDACFHCGKPRPSSAAWVRELWNESFLPRDVQALRRNVSRDAQNVEGENGEAKEAGKGGRGEGNLAANKKDNTSGPKGEGKAALPVGGVKRQEEGGKAGGKGGVEAEARAPFGAKPKAKASKTGEVALPAEEKPWAEIPAPYIPPALNRVELVAREQALRERMEELASEDPRRELAGKRIEETGAAIKDAGGHSGRKLVWSFMDGQKQLKAAGAKIESAQAELHLRQAAAAKALEDEAKAEMDLAALKAKEHNCRQRNAHLAMQVAVEATIGVEGYGELEAQLSYVGVTLQAAGLVHAEAAFKAVAGFVRKFAPQQYNQAMDPVLRELDSAASTATIDVENERVDWMELEARGEAREIARASTPKAFETSIATLEAARLCQTTAQDANLPAVCAIWKKSRAAETGDVGRKLGAAKAVGASKRAVGNARAHSEEKLVHNKVSKQATRKRALSLVRPPRHEAKQVPELMDIMEEEKGLAINSGASGRRSSRGTQIVERGRSRSVSRERSRKRGLEEGTVPRASTVEGQRRNGRKKHGWGPEGGAPALAFEHCLGCGAGPLQESLLTARCVCGGPLCETCQGANACIRCNGSEDARHGRKLLG